MSRWLIALDIDGTIVHDDGFVSPRVYEQVQRVKSLGHEVVIATGRSAANSYPIARELDFPGENAVASNGAVSYRYDNQGFEVVEVESLEDIRGPIRVLHHPVSRVVVLSPSHDVDQFLGLMKQVGLHSVSYSIGYSAWLDIAPDGVHKGHGLEKLRQKLEIDPKRIICIGDGRNDIEMFQWAKNAGGHSFAMGQAPDEVKLAATAVTASVEQDGVAEVLSGFEGLEFIHAS